MGALLVFGRIGRAHGLRGEVHLFPYNGASDMEALAMPVDAEVVIPGGATSQGPRVLTLVSARATANSWLVHFRGIDDRTAAETLRSAELWLRRSALEALQEDEVFVEDLVGCTVADLSGRVRGTVRGTLWNGAHDVLSVVDADGGEWLVPLVPEFLVSVDRAARHLVVDPHE